VRRVKPAILGTGDVAGRDYLPEMGRLADRATVVAVCDRTGARGRAVADQFGATWFGDYHQMLAHGDADAVINLTPIQAHDETTLAALAAGKHVYTEKPVATTVSAGERMRDLARQRGLIVVCAPSVLVFPQVQTARRLLEEGAIGQVYAARGVGHGGVPPWEGYTSDPSPFFALGGGPLRDMGVYPLHALTGLLGLARRVTALSARTRPSFVVGDGPAAGKRVHLEVDDNWQLILDLGAARLATVEANNCAQATRAPQLELMGVGGTIALSLLDMTAPVELLRPGQEWQAIPAPDGARRAGPDHLLGVEHLIQCIQAGTPPLLSLDHALHVLAVVEAAERSAATGATVQLSDQ